jgi:hypothetical protein
MVLCWVKGLSLVPLALNTFLLRSRHFPVTIIYNNALIGVIDNMAYKGRGGKKEGAGRPVSEATKVIRVPYDVSADECRQIPALRDKITAALIECERTTSPRYDALRGFLGELRDMGF